MQLHAANLSSQSQNNFEVSTRYEPPQAEPKKEEEIQRDPSIPDDQLPSMHEKVTDKAPSPELVIPPSSVPEEKVEVKAEAPEQPAVKQEEEHHSSIQQSATKKSVEVLQ